MIDWLLDLIDRRPVKRINSAYTVVPEDMNRRTRLLVDTSRERVELVIPRAIAEGYNHEGAIEAALSIEHVAGDKPYWLKVVWV